MSGAHTPTPWSVGENDEHSGQTNIMAEEIYIAGAIHTGVESERDANAAYIVECVNSHAQLLATTAKLRERNEAMTRVLVAVRKRIRNVFVEDRVEDAIACRDCMEQIDALLPTPSVQS